MGAVVLSAETIDSTIELVMVERADALQYQFDSGPCLTAGRDQVPVRVDDIDGETRWRPAPPSTPPTAEAVAKSRRVSHERSFRK
jgi:hypothetical protein